ncbi:hypothetical protein ISF_03740 [Cordyceps fumosorosea ARSEF 2679]|uniref:Uncharacterized protein n=1 Tax=Cordyceps fumosorosea (strain ARSEF 2679) TaxID=1081104 RepID=A0A167ZIN9_CORFA|nr:hypothetical protein ISF_03740 [Cordyceps fumosorosea ARSEF 2679]OAA67564.1 hypothetical protein ISF_03740 [Cordyceps fumosorosea ARSEF 2679]
MRGRSLSFDNPVKFPFLVLIWAEGSKPRWDDDSPPRPLRDKLLGQMAAIQVSPSSAAQEDMRSYVASFESMGSPEATYMRRVQTAPDVHFRTMYVESLFSMGAHAALAAEGWKLPGCELLEEEKEDGVYAALQSEITG